MAGEIPEALDFLVDWNRTTNKHDPKQALSELAELLDAHLYDFVADIQITPREESEPLIDLAFLLRSRLHDLKGADARDLRPYLVALAWWRLQRHTGRAWRAPEVARRGRFHRNVANRVLTAFDFLAHPEAHHGDELSSEDIARLQPALQKVGRSRLSYWLARPPEPPLSSRQHQRLGERALAEARPVDAGTHLYWATQADQPSKDVHYAYGLALLELVDEGRRRQLPDEELLEHVKALFTRQDFPGADQRDRDVDWIGLEARLFRTMASAADVRDVDRNLWLRCAFHAYQRAFDLEPLSHYAAGQTAAAWARVHAATRTANTEQRLEQVVERALAVAQRAVSLDTDVWAYFTLGELYVLQGRPADAAPYYQGAFEREPQPTPRQVQSARGGLERSAQAVGLSTDDVAAISKLLL